MKNKNIKSIKNLLLLKILIITLVVPYYYCPNFNFTAKAYAAAKWQVMTISDDLQHDMAELEHYCLMHDVTVADVLWANNLSEYTLTPGTQIFLPNSQPDVLAIWQNKGAWQPKALVQTTSAAAAERARGVSGYQPKAASQNDINNKSQIQQQTAPQAQAPEQPKQQVPARTAAEAEISARLQTPLQVKTKTQTQTTPQNLAPMPASIAAQTQNKNQAQAQVNNNDAANYNKIQAKANADNQDNLETEPIIILSPNGDPATGPMRLVISNGQVKVVNIPKNAAPRVPQMPNLDHPFGANLIPNPSQPLPPADPSRLLPRFQQGRTSAMIWPVDGKVSSPFGQRGQRRHTGIDIPMPPGTPIQAARDGVVARTGNNSTMGFRGYGNFVLLDHGGGIKTLYAHCLSVNVKEGQRIRQGQVLAAVGRTGRASTDHVHFEVRINDKPVNPMPYLERVQVAKK